MEKWLRGTDDGPVLHLLLILHIQNRLHRASDGLRELVHVPQPCLVIILYPSNSKYAELDHPSNP